jgi:hypothetical protein
VSHAPRRNDPVGVSGGCRDAPQSTVSQVYPGGTGDAFSEAARRAIDREEGSMNNIFYIIGVVVVVLFILGYLGFR